MATIGSLVVDLSASSAKFANDLQKADRTLSSREARMNRSLRTLDRGFDKARRGAVSFTRSLRSMGGAIGLLAGAASVTGLTLLAKRSLDTAATLRDTADRVAFMTDSLQELRFAAGQVGVETRQLDLGLQRFSRRVAEAAQGQGELLGTVQQYGIQLRDTNTGALLPSIAIFKQFAEVIRGAGSEQEQLRIAFKLFDSEGAALVNLMRQGAAGVEAYQRRAQDLGLVLDEVLIRQAGAAADKLDELGAAMQAKITGTLIRMAPVIQDVTTKLLDLFEAFGRPFEGDLPLGERSIGRLQEDLRAAEALRTQLVEQRTGLELLAQNLGTAPSSELPGLQRRINTLETRIAVIQSIMDTRSFAEAHAAEQRRSATSGPGLLPPAASKLTVQLRPLDVPLRPATVRALEHLNGRLQETVKQFEDWRAEAAGIEAATRTPFENYIKQQERINDLHDRQLIDLETRNRALDQAEDQFRQLDPAISKATETGRAFGSVLVSGLDSIVDGTKSASEALDELGRSIAKIAFNALVGNPLETFLGNLFGSFLTPSAAGGFRQGGQPLLVGERGPEMFVPSGAGRVIPNGQVGGGVEVHLHLPANTEANVRETQTGNGGRRIDVMIDEAMAKNVRPGSRFGAAMERSFGLSAVPAGR